jgi:hypothetical protein
MVYAGTNFLAVVVAAIAAFMFGGAYYGVLSKQWMAAADLSFEELTASGGAKVAYAVTIISLLIMGTVLAGILGHFGQVTTKSGLITGALLWLGFVVTVMATGTAYQRKKIALLVIDAGYWLAVLLILGGVIGAFGT